MSVSVYGAEAGKEAVGDRRKQSWLCRGGTKAEEGRKRVREERGKMCREEEGGGDISGLATMCPRLLIHASFGTWHRASPSPLLRYSILTLFPAVPDQDRKGLAEPHPCPSLLSTCPHQCIQVSPGQSIHERDGPVTLTSWIRGARTYALEQHDQGGPRTDPSSSLNSLELCVRARDPRH